MKKQVIFRTIAMVLALCIIAALTGCKKSTVYYSSYYEDGDTAPVVSSSGNASSEGDKNSDVASITADPPKNIDVIEIDDSKSKTSLTRDQVIAKMPSSLKGTTIKYMYWWNPKEQMEKDAIADFEKATGITIKPVVASYGGFYQSVAAKIAAGDSPDIVRLISNVDSTIDMLQPITNSGFDFNDTAWDSTVLKDYTFNGKCYAANLTNSAVMDYAVIYYNKNSLNAAELEDPYKLWKQGKWTWSTFWNMCDEFVKANKKSSETYYGATFEYPDAYVRAMGGALYTYDNAAGKFVSTLNSNAMKVGWQRTADAISKNWLIKTHDVTLFDQGKILFFWSGPYSIRKGDNRQADLKKQNKLGVVPLPTDSKTQTVYEYTAFGIPKGAKNTQAVPYYLRWVLDQTSYDMHEIWYDNQAYDVMQYVGNNTPIFYGSYWYEAFFNDIYAGGSNQVQSVIDSYKNVIELYASQQNERIALY